MPGGKITIGGSSSVTPIMEKLIEAYKKINTGAEIELNQTDSTSGMTNAIDGSIDIGMASRELTDSEKTELTPVQIAIDGIAVVVNPENITDNLTKDQVKAVSYTHLIRITPPKAITCASSVKSSIRK